MSLEIERRFIVTGDVRHLCRDGDRIIQGYLPADGPQTVRVRLRGDTGFLTIKGPRQGCVRVENEWEIDPHLAWQVLCWSCSGAILRKTRYCIRHAGFDWELDVFEGRHAGLVIAEVELASADQPVSLPDWVGPEITGDRRYSNSSLARQECDDMADAA
jgi:CYTH domain-containing protein